MVDVWIFSLGRNSPFFLKEFFVRRNLLWAEPLKIKWLCYSHLSHDWNGYMCEFLVWLDKVPLFNSCFCQTLGWWKRYFEVSQLFFSLVDVMFIKDRAQVNAVADTTSTEKLLFFLKPSFCFFGDLFQTAAIQIAERSSWKMI